MTGRPHPWVLGHGSFAGEPPAPVTPNRLPLTRGSMEKDQAGGCMGILLHTRREVTLCIDPLYGPHLVTYCLGSPW